MAESLLFDGVNDYCTFPNAVNCNVGTDAWTIEIVASFSSVNANGSCVLGGALTSANDGFLLTNTGRLSAMTASTNRILSNAGFIIFDSTVRTYRLEHDAGGAFRFYRDGSLFQSGTFSSSFTFNGGLGVIGKYRPNVEWYIGMKLERITLTGFTNNSEWKAVLSGGTGSTLPTTAANNNATLINFPTDNTQWQGFSSAATANIAYSVDGFTFSASSTITAPTITATGSYSIDGFTFAASSTIIAPTVSASATYNIDVFSFAAIARASNTLNCSYDLGSFNASVSALVASNISTTASYDIGEITLSISAIAPQNEPERTLSTKDNPYWRNSIFFNTSRRY